MHIGIDISQISYNGTGVARYTSGLVSAILKYDRDNYWTFFYSGLRQKLDSNLEKQIYKNHHNVVKWYLPPKVLSLLWNTAHKISTNYSIYPKSARPIDWFITSDWTEAPMGISRHKATIIHDLVFRKFPKTVDKTVLQTQEKRLDLVASESDVIFTDSHSTKKDLETFYDVRGEVIVNYPGFDYESFQIKPVSEGRTPTRKLAEKSPRYILTVGKLEPRKNLESLVLAYSKARLVSKNPDAFPELWIVGMKGWGESNLKTEGVRLLGFVPDSKLAGLYAHALFFIFPSLYEGFGFPALEAMATGCPTALANTSSLAEIGDGGVSLLFDPQNSSSIQDAIQTMIDNPQLREELGAKGLARVRDFTWETHIRTILETFGRI